MPTVSITIMAHPERKEMAEALSKELQAPVIYDRKNNIWDTCRRAWLAHPTDTDFALVLQDDAIVCKAFKAELRKLVSNGDYLYSLYSSNVVKTRLENAHADGKDHILTHHIYNEIALCMRTEYIMEMVEFCDSREAENDHEITNWAWRKALPIYYPYESLVDHRDTESIYRRSTQKKFTNAGERKAFNFKGK